MKIAFCIFACATQARYKEELLGILHTWGERAAKLGHIIYYFLGEEQTEFKGDQFIYLPGVSNDYASASHKQNRGLKMIYEKHRDEYDFVYVCGTDTYVNIENLIALMEKYDTNDPFILGGDGGYRTIADKEVYFNSGGPGTVLSRRSMELLYPLFENMFERWRDLCNTNNINLVAACDVATAYYGAELGIYPIKEDTKFFHCNFRESKVDINNVVATHFVRIEDFEILHNIYYPWDRFYGWFDRPK